MPYDTRPVYVPAYLKILDPETIIVSKRFVYECDREIIAKIVRNARHSHTRTHNVKTRQSSETQRNRRSFRLEMS